MSKMSERQREYLLGRVSDLVWNEKQGYELQLADKKETMAKKLYTKKELDSAVKKAVAKMKKGGKVKGSKKGGGVFLSSGAPIPKKTVARGSGAARTQYFRKNG